MGQTPLTIYVNGKRQVVGVADVLQDGSVHASIFPELTGEVAQRIIRGDGAEFSLSVYSDPIKPRRVVPSADTRTVTTAMELTAWLGEAFPPSKER